MLALDAPKMFLNIELKGPSCPKIAERYDYIELCKQVRDLIDKYKIAGRTMVSSFNQSISDCIRKMAKKRQVFPDFVIF